MNCKDAHLAVSRRDFGFVSVVFMVFLTPDCILLFRLFNIGVSRAWDGSLATPRGG